MPENLTTLQEHACFGGTVAAYAHHSKACDAEMRFAVFIPSQAAEGPVPVLYYLAGLTSTEETFITKGGAQRYAAEHGLMLVAPDTSPRGLGLPGEDDDYDFGSGAGFYIDATVEPWAKYYRMYTYVTRELPALVEARFPASPGVRGIFGHSMGGHGALTLALKNPDLYRSISAFAPITAPTGVPWGQKAFSGYLGPDEEVWREHDATELMRRRPFPDGRVILVDQGDADEFLEEQLSPGVFEDACREAGQPLTLRWREGYDHGYYFISTFMEDHIRHHAAVL
ncbi:MAG: S-formylglutathione hydrolase, partial [Actinomycetota bacterium]|nr:S-formylglutathione hydrolase [Actinomycetota bacterium]